MLHFIGPNYEIMYIPGDSNVFSMVPIASLLGTMPTGFFVLPLFLPDISKMKCKNYFHIHSISSIMQFCICMLLLQL